MKNILQEIEVFSCIFYGIYEGKLFIQIATRNNEIAYEAETSLVNSEPTTIVNALYELFSDNFKESGVKASRVAILEWDGQKIVKSGEKDILNCGTVKDKVPNLGKFIFSFLWEN
jgi:hypothetical protein